MTGSSEKERAKREKTAEERRREEKDLLSLLPRRLPSSPSSSRSPLAGSVRRYRRLPLSCAAYAVYVEAQLSAEELLEACE